MTCARRLWGWLFGPRAVRQRCCDCGRRQPVRLVQWHEDDPDKYFVCDDCARTWGP